MTPTTTTSMVVVGGVLAFFLMVQLVVGVPPYTYDGYASDGKWNLYAFLIQIDRK